MIVEAVRVSDLSLLGPINAWKSVLSLLPGIFLLGEIPSVAGFVGILFIVAGSHSLPAEGATPSGRFLNLLKSPGVQLRFGALALSSLEAVFLKRAIQASNPYVAFLCWSVLGLAVSAIFVLARQGRATLIDQFQRLSQKKRLSLLLFLTTGVMQLSSLVTFKYLQVGYALALFQISSVVSVLLGHKIFAEGHLHRRLFAATLMSIGAVIIIMAN
jgi:uncharacterized membrane protein